MSWPSLFVIIYIAVFLLDPETANGHVVVVVLLLVVVVIKFAIY